MKMVPLRVSIVFLTLFKVSKVAGDISDHHRVRRFVLTKDSKIAFDFNLLMPVPILGSMDVLGVVEIPVSVVMTNDSFSWQPITLPYLVMAPSAPIQSPLPILSSFNPTDDSSPLFPYNSHHPNHNYFSVHHIVKRNTAMVASRHRIDLLSGIAACLNELNIDGSACINKFICQLAHSPLLIETPLHEILEHILTISKGLLVEGDDSDHIKYLEAERLGKMKGNCTQVYETCWFDIFEMVQYDD